MLDFLFTIVFFLTLGVVAFGFHEWLEKIEVEKEYLQNLLDEQKNNRNKLRKNI